MSAAAERLHEVRSQLGVIGVRELVTAASVAAAVLAATSTGSLVVAAVLVGVGTLDRRSGAAVLLAALAVSIRFAGPTFDDLAGIQSVLGPAGVVGPETGAASAWCAGGAVILATRVPPVADVASATGGRLWRFAPPLATGLVAAALVAGPGPDDPWVRIGASLAGVLLATAVTLLDRRRLAEARAWLAVLAGLAACVLAGWPS